MKQLCFTMTFLIFCMGLTFFSQIKLAEKRSALLQKTYINYCMPSQVTIPASLNFKGIVADFLFLKISILLGDTILNTGTMSDKHADFIYNAANFITDLDPWFWDAYLFASMTLSWDFNRVDLANKLLKKATQYRKNDFKPAYYLGFNHFYFLKDNENGARLLMKASKLPGAPSYLASLATRLYMYSNQYKPAIIFLNDILNTTQSMDLKKQYKKRLRTLIIMDTLEQKVDVFKKTFGVFPNNLKDLVEKGIIKFIPKDPYGGEFKLLKNKRVYTTSKLLTLIPKKK